MNTTIQKAQNTTITIRYSNTKVKLQKLCINQCAQHHFKETSAQNIGIICHRKSSRQTLNDNGLQTTSSKRQSRISQTRPRLAYCTMHHPSLVLKAFQPFHNHHYSKANKYSYSAKLPNDPASEKLKGKPVLPWNTPVLCTGLVEPAAVKITARTPNFTTACTAPCSLPTAPCSNGN